MNENTDPSLLSARIPDQISQRDVATATDPIFAHNEATPHRTTENNLGLQCSNSRDNELSIDRKPMFVTLASSCISNPSSKELLVDKKSISNESILRKYFNKGLEYDWPSISAGITGEIYVPRPLPDSESREELQMMIINFQSNNDILLEENESEKESKVVSYVQNKDAIRDALLSLKKDSSLFDSVPKKENILEGEQLFYPYEFKGKIMKK